MNIENYVPQEHRTKVLKLLQDYKFKKHIIDWQFSRSSKSTPIIATNESVVVGFNGIMPVKVRLRSSSIDAHWSCDFFVDPSSRRQGVGKTLKTRLDEKYGLMMALGVSEAGQRALTQAGWKKLAGPRRFIRIISATSFRRRAICSLQRVVYGLFSRDYDDGLSTTLVPINELPPSAEISALCNQVIQDYSACVVRDWEYLNWRYIESPVGTYSIILVHQSSTLKALAIVSHRGRDVSLVDYLGPRNAPKIKNRIVRRLLELGSSATKIDCTTSDRGFVIQLMRNGFLSPTYSKVAFFVRDSNNVTNQAKTSWFLMDGDSDPEILRCAHEGTDKITATVR